MFEVWMRILGRVESSVLWLLEGDGPASSNLRKEAAMRNIAPGRLVFARTIPFADHLARQQLADLFLDTLPFNAGATASAALRAGLPLLTCMGEKFAGRMAASLLRAIGMPELVTTSAAAYEDLAVEIALTEGRAQELKERLALNLHSAPLFDATRFTRHLEAAYNLMHERSLQGLSPQHICVPKL
jgi:predicted O-linked N-acetylglucosamine transferase (SPINDLY family)